MAVPARFLIMCPFQFVAGKGMFETDLPPAGVLMAGPAILSGIIFFVQVLCMDILVAIITLDPDLPEFPAIGFPVAVKAGYGQVGSSQGKGCLLVAFNGIKGGGEPVLCVTLGAIGLPAIRKELLTVIVLVAVCTALMFEFHRVTILMTGSAFDCFMFSI